MQIGFLIKWGSWNRSWLNSRSEFSNRVVNPSHCREAFSIVWWLKTRYVGWCNRAQALTCVAFIKMNSLNEAGSQCLHVPVDKPTVLVACNNRPAKILQVLRKKARKYVNFMTSKLGLRRNIKIPASLAAGFSSLWRSALTISENSSMERGYFIRTYISLRAHCQQNMLNLN